MTSGFSLSWLPESTAGGLECSAWFELEGFDEFRSIGESGLESGDSLSEWIEDLDGFASVRFMVDELRAAGVMIEGSESRRVTVIFGNSFLA